ncbi:MAG: hypothetical protein WAK35_19335, partial [Xanthobacteraceae bacterium]
IYAPQRWEKTEHGMARTSRVAGSHRLRPPRQPLPDQSRQRPVREPRPRMTGGRAHDAHITQIGPAMPIAPMKIMETARGTPLAR